MLIVVIGPCHAGAVVLWLPSPTRKRHSDDLKLQLSPNLKGFAWSSNRQLSNPIPKPEWLSRHWQLAAWARNVTGQLGCHSSVQQWLWIRQACPLCFCDSDIDNWCCAHSVTVLPARVAAGSASQCQDKGRPWHSAAADIEEFTIVETNLEAKVRSTNQFICLDLVFGPSPLGTTTQPGRLWPKGKVYTTNIMLMVFGFWMSCSEGKFIPHQNRNTYNQSQTLTFVSHDPQTSILNTCET